MQIITLGIWKWAPETAIASNFPIEASKTPAEGHMLMQLDPKYLPFEFLSFFAYTTPFLWGITQRSVFTAEYTRLGLGC